MPEKNLGTAPVPQEVRVLINSNPDIVSGELDPTTVNGYLLGSRRGIPVPMMPLDPEVQAKREAEAQAALRNDDNSAENEPLTQVEIVTKKVKGTLFKAASELLGNHHRHDYDNNRED